MFKFLARRKAKLDPEQYIREADLIATFRLFGLEESKWPYWTYLIDALDEALVDFVRGVESNNGNNGNA